MYSFSKDLLSTYWRPGTVPELGAAMNKISRVSLRGVYTLVHVFGAARIKQATNQSIRTKKSYTCYAED